MTAQFPNLTHRQWSQSQQTIQIQNKKFEKQIVNLEKKCGKNKLSFFLQKVLHKKTRNKVTKITTANRKLEEKVLQSAITENTVTETSQKSHKKS